MKHYADLSLETHLFFAKIMKEHALFLEAGFPSKETAWVQKAEWFRKQFEQLLFQVVEISQNRIWEPVLNSQEIITPYTISAERQTQSLSGIPIDIRISKMEQQLRTGNYSF